jgi:hypothetical protein
MTKVLQLAERGVLAFACSQAGRLREGIEVCDTACQRLPRILGMVRNSSAPARSYYPICAGVDAPPARPGQRGDRGVRTSGDSGASARENELVSALAGRVRVELDIIFANPAAALDHARRALEAGEKVGTPTARMNALWALGTAHRLNKQGMEPSLCCTRWQARPPAASIASPKG